MIAHSFSKMFHGSRPAAAAWLLLCGCASFGQRPTTSTTAEPPAAGLQFYPLTPCRLVDTRGAAFGFVGVSPFSGPSIPSGGTVTFPVMSTAEQQTTAPAPCGVIPSTAQAYSLNITLVPTGGGPVNYLTIWPAGSPKPYVSTLNDLDGLILPNAAVVPAGTPNGGISVFNSGPSTTDVVIDMNGYFAPPSSGLQFYPVEPCRIVDTRGAAGGFIGVSPFSGPSIPSGGTVTFPVQSAAQQMTTAPAPCGAIPSTAQAYSLNVTLAPTGGGSVNYFSIWPAGAARPMVSTLNDLDGLTIPNAAIVPAGTPNGGISVFNSGPAATNVIIDMNGYFAPPGNGLQFFPVAPCRLVDTRGALGGFTGVSPFSGPAILAKGTVTFPLQSSSEQLTTAPAPCGAIPSGAQAYSLNLALVPSPGGTVNYLSIWPAGSTQPDVSTMNDLEGMVIANAAFVLAGTPSGGVSVFNFGPAIANLVIDMNGYFAGSSLPVITSPTAASGAVGSAFSYQITATNSPTSFGAMVLPVGLSVNTVTGLISGTPTVAGTSTVTLSATNSSGTGTATLTLTIGSIPPVITSATTATGPAGVAFSYQITATNNPTSFGATGLPSGLSVNTATGVISGTPAKAGTSSVTLSATNTSGTGTATLTLTVSHSVGLTWQPSTSNDIAYYNVYRGTTNNGPYPTKLNSSGINGTSFTDTTVQLSKTYYYVATAVDTAGNESVDSNQATAKIPAN